MLQREVLYPSTPGKVVGNQLAGDGVQMDGLGPTVGGLGGVELGEASTEALTL